MITPGAVVGDIDTVLATGTGGYECAVGIEDGLVEELGRLLLPDLEADLIEDVLEGFDVLGGESSAEVTGGGRVGDAVGADRIEKDEVVASQFDVVEAGAIAEGVVGEVEDVIGLVIGEVELEQVESVVDGLREAEFPQQELDGTDAARGDGASLVGDVIVDIRCGEDGLWRWGGDGPIEPLANFPLAVGVMSVWNRAHSKSPCGLGHGICVGQSNVPETPGDFEFFIHDSRDSRLGPRLVKA
jgi:hypothetical protein